jgi:signal transduction histidine kinase
VLGRRADAWAGGLRGAGDGSGDEELDAASVTAKSKRLSTRDHSLRQAFQGCSAVGGNGSRPGAATSCRPATWRPGVGLRSIAEREEELGGTATAGPAANDRRVTTRIPIHNSNA